eukprot:6477770-Amphidinium_carterae.1
MLDVVQFITNTILRQCVSRSIERLDKLLKCMPRATLRLVVSHGASHEVSCLSMPVVIQSFTPEPHKIPKSKSE